MDVLKIIYDSIPWKKFGFIHKYPFNSNLLQTYNKLFPWPKTLLIHVGNNCNYDCIYCYADREAKNKELTIEDWFKIIDKTVDIGIESIGFSGGEPFLYPDFLSLLSHSAKKVPFISIFTNGSLLNEKWIHKIKKLDADVQIVIKFDSHLTYGLHTKRHEMFENIEEVIKKCIENELRVVTFITITKYNLKYLDDIIKSAVELGTYPFIERYIPIKDPESNKELEINEKDMEKVLKSIIETYPDFYNLSKSLRYPTKGLCGCFSNLISITFDGFVLPCPYIPCEANLGNVKEESLEDIWKKYKKKQKDWLKIPEECEGCKNKNLCCGGCKTYTYLKYGTTDEKDPLCIGRIPPNYCHVAFLASFLRKDLKSSSTDSNKTLMNNKSD